jgi:hypothetical protein
MPLMQESAIGKDEVRIINTTADTISAVISQERDGVQKNKRMPPPAPQPEPAKEISQVSVKEESSQMISILPGKESIVTVSLLPSARSAYVTVLYSHEGAIKLVMLNRLVQMQTDLVVSPLDLVEVEEVEDFPGITGAHQLVSPTLVNNRRPPVLLGKEDHHLTKNNTAVNVLSKDSGMENDFFVKELHKKLLEEHDEQVVNHHQGVARAREERHAKEREAQAATDLSLQSAGMR